MAEDHRVEQPKPLRHARCRQKGEGGKQVRPEEERAQHRRAGAEPQVKPVDEQALDHEAPRQCVHRLQAGQPEHDAAGAVQPQSSRTALWGAGHFHRRGKPRVQKAQHHAARSIRPQ